MASYSKKIIFIALILTIAIPLSTCHREKGRRSDKGTKRHLRDLCTKTNRSKECWNILKSKLRIFDNSDDKTVATSVIDLAVAKSNEIYKKLNEYYMGSRDDKLKERYDSCAINYNKASFIVSVVHTRIDSDNYRDISVLVDHAKEELTKCKHVFGQESSDPTHIRDRNKEFDLYLEIARVAVDRLVK